MPRIGVLADTHLADTGAAYAFLQDLIERQFAAVDLILHAGDIVAPGLLTALSPCPVLAVRGNMDPAAPDLPLKRVVEVAGVRIGLIHGWGPPAGLTQRVRRDFADLLVDCLVFGHSHVPMCQRQGGLLLFNPGSATDRRGQPNCSVGLLEVQDGAIRGRIIMLGDK